MIPHPKKTRWDRDLFVELACFFVGSSCLSIRTTIKEKEQFQWGLASLSVTSIFCAKKEGNRDDRTSKIVKARSARNEMHSHGHVDFRKSKAVISGLEQLGPQLKRTMAETWISWHWDSLLRFSLRVSNRITKTQQQFFAHLLGEDVQQGCVQGDARALPEAHNHHLTGTTC